MGELLSLFDRTPKLTPEHKAHLIQRCVDLALEIGEGKLDVALKESELALIIRRLGMRAIKDGDAES